MFIQKAFVIDLMVTFQVDMMSTSRLDISIDPSTDSSLQVFNFCNFCCL